MEAELNIETDLDVKGRKDIALAVLAEAKAQRLLGNLVSMDLVIEIIDGTFTVIQAFLASFSARVASDLSILEDPRQIERYLDETIMTFVDQELSKDSIKANIESIVRVREERIKKRNGKL